MEEEVSEKVIQNKHFQIDEVHYFVEWFDAAVEKDLKDILADTANDMASVLRYLRLYHPALYYCMESLSSIHSHCSHQIEAIQKVYKHITSIESRAKYIEEKRENRPTKAKKRARQASEPEKISFDDDARAFDAKDRKVWYVLKTQYVAGSGPLFVDQSSGNPVEAEQDAALRTLYHCDGLWTLEQLSDQLDKELVPNVRLKDITATEDTVRWKVATTEEFVPDAPVRRDRKGLRK